MRIAFLIRDLDRGGSQVQLRNLASGLLDRKHDVSVACFYEGGELEDTFREAGLRVIPLGKRGRWDGPGFLYRLVRTLRAARPDVVYSMLSAANVGSVLARPFLPRTRIVWGLRSAYMDLHRYDWIHAAGYGLERRLVRFADRVLVNSEAGRAYAAAQGFPVEQLRVVANGIDTERFQPDEPSRRQVRSSWNLDEDAPVVGIVGRIDAMKDHPTFLRAAAIAIRRFPAFRFVCVGSGPRDESEHLQSLATDLGLRDSLIWAGTRADMPSVYSALDVLCLSSIGEGFPNVVAEAMACGVYCVVTDVGDAGRIVGDTGTVVPSGKPDALAEALLAARERIRGSDGAARRRRRIVEKFSLARMVDQTETQLLRLVSEKSG